MQCAAVVVCLIFWFILLYLPNGYEVVWIFLGWNLTKRLLNRMMTTTLEKISIDGDNSRFYADSKNVITKIRVLSVKKKGKNKLDRAYKVVNKSIRPYCDGWTEGDHGKCHPFGWTGQNAGAVQWDSFYLFLVWAVHLFLSDFEDLLLSCVAQK